MPDRAAPTRFFVQFSHPGAEHNPGGARRQPWNTGSHRRKFLQSYGLCVAEDGSSSLDDLVFWGEWEGPSSIIKRWKTTTSLPQFLHLPVWEHPSVSTPRQNTDPWIFGDTFRFSNCRQLTPKRKRSSLQALTLGSLIIFGSTISGEFAMDTVFVVGNSCRFSPGEPPETDEAFRVCTVESLLTTGNVDDPLTLYRGATYDAPIDGMYSFVPCRRAHAENARFPRPRISLGRYVNPKSTQSARRTEGLSQEDLREQWENIRKQVLDADCLLGVWFRTPELG